jgi:hypothetical protein
MHIYEENHKNGEDLVIISVDDHITEPGNMFDKQLTGEGNKSGDGCNQKHRRSLITQLLSQTGANRNRKVKQQLRHAFGHRVDPGGSQDASLHGVHDDEV